jgi:hypothetical protein
VLQYYLPCIEALSPKLPGELPLVAADVDVNVTVGGLAARPAFFTSLEKIAYGHTPVKKTPLKI